MRVALVTGYLSRSGGGVATSVEALSRALDEHGGIEVRVFGLRDEAWDRADEALWHGAPATALPVTGPRAFGHAPGLERELLAFAPSLVHTHGLWLHPSRSVTRWQRRTGGHAIVSPHGMLDRWALRQSGLKKRLAALLYENAHLSRASAIHALCAAEHDAVRAFGLRQAIETIPNGVELPPDVAKPAAPWRDKVPAGKRIALYLGRLHRKKNLEALLHAWAVRQADPKDRHAWHLVLAGWGEDGYEARLRRTIDKLGLARAATLVGPLFGADKAAAYRNADAFVLPSLSEGLPMVVLEAASYGLPVLMTQACNLPQAFDRDAAWQLDPEPAAMARDLGTALALPAKRLRAIGGNGRRWMAQEFSWNSVAARMAELYRRTSDRGTAAA